MKSLKFGLLIVLVVGLGFGFSGGKNVAAAEMVTSYIPLVRDADLNSIPVQELAQRELALIMPALTKAQNKGQISGFHPELRYGLLVVRHPAYVDLAKALGRTAFTSAREAVAPRVIEDLRASQRSVDGKAGTRSFYFDVYGSCMNGWNLPAATDIQITVRDTAGSIVGMLATTTDSGGYFWDCLYWLPDATIFPGYKVTAKVMTATPATYSVTAPNITFTKVDKVTSQVTFIGPKGKTYWAYWSHPNLDAGHTYKTASLTGTVPTSGVVVADFGTTKMRGGDYFDFHAQVNTNFQAGVYSNASYLGCTLGDNYCWLYGIPFTPASITIKQGAKTYSFSGTFDDRGYYWASLYQSDGMTKILLKPGSVVKGTDVPDLTLPTFTTQAVAWNDTVKGVAPLAYKYLDVTMRIYENSSYQYCWAYTKANSSMAFVADFSSTCPFTTSDMVTSYGWFTYPTTGHQVRSPYYNIGP